MGLDCMRWERRRLGKADHLEVELTNYFAEKKAA
jgi:hypothetical protein